jgi:hypothetical protein
VFPIGILLGSAIAISHVSPTNIYGRHPLLYVMAFGMASAKITNKLVVCTASPELFFGA